MFEIKVFYNLDSASILVSNPYLATAPAPSPGHESCQGEWWVQDVATTAATAPQGPEEAIVPSAVPGRSAAATGLDSGHL